MTNISEQLRSKLRLHGYSLTAPRLQIFNALQDHEPLSMHELIKNMPGVDRASVYRTVELFTRLGIIERLQFGWKYKLELSDDYAPHHHHLMCTQCSAVQVVSENDTLERLIHALAEQADFTPTGHQIEIRGLCKNCRDTKKIPGNPGSVEASHFHSHHSA